LITLDLAVAEVGNVAWERAILYEEDEDTTLAALRDCQDFIAGSCALLRSFDLVEEAYKISVEDKIAFYDSLFLAAAGQTAAAHPAAELAGHARRRRPLASFSRVQYKKSSSIGFHELNDLQ
jgi:hypothetical protein